MLVSIMIDKLFSELGENVNESLPVSAQLDSDAEYDQSNYMFSLVVCIHKHKTVDYTDEKKSEELFDDKIRQLAHRTYLVFNNSTDCSGVYFTTNPDDDSHPMIAYDKTTSTAIVSEHFSNWQGDQEYIHKAYITIGFNITNDFRRIFRLFSSLHNIKDMLDVSYNIDFRLYRRDSDIIYICTSEIPVSFCHYCLYYKDTEMFKDYDFDSDARMEKVWRIIGLMFNPEKYYNHYDELKDNPEKLELYLKITETASAITNAANKINNSAKASYVK